MRPTLNDLIQQITKRFIAYKALGNNIPDLPGIIAREFIKEAMRYYSEKEARDWLSQYHISLGKNLEIIKPRESKEKSKRKYLPDGTYVLNGVRFGEPKKPLTKEEKIVQEILENNNPQIAH